jgi:hypothetical protein
MAPYWATYQNVSTTAMSSLIIVVIDEYVSMFIIAHTPTLKNKNKEIENQLNSA